MTACARGYGLREAITGVVVQEGSIVVVVILDASADLASLNQLREDVVASPLVIQLTGDATLTSNGVSISTVQSGAVVSGAPTTPPPSFAPAPTAASNTDTSGSSSGDDGDDDATIAIVVVFAVLLIAGMICGAILYNRRLHSHNRDSRAPAHANPVYGAATTLESVDSVAAQNARPARPMSYA